MPVSKKINQRFECYFEMLPCSCSTAEDLIIGARALLHSTEDAENGRVLLAKAICGNQALLLSADQDNYEFSLRVDGRRAHVAGGFAAADLRDVTILQLKEAMCRYLADGTPLPIQRGPAPRRTSVGRRTPSDW